MVTIALIGLCLTLFVIGATVRWRSRLWAVHTKRAADTAQTDLEAFRCLGVDERVGSAIAECIREIVEIPHFRIEVDDNLWTDYRLLQADAEELLNDLAMKAGRIVPVSTGRIKDIQTVKDLALFISSLPASDNNTRTSESG